MKLRRVNMAEVDRLRLAIPLSKAELCRKADIAYSTFKYVQSGRAASELVAAKLAVGDGGAAAVASQLDVLTPKQVAKLFGVHYRTVLDWIHTGALQASLINERFYVRREWIDEMLERTSNRQQRPA